MSKLRVKNKLVSPKGPWWRKLASPKGPRWRKLVVQKVHQLKGRGLVRMEIRVVKLVEVLKVDQNSSLSMKRLKDWLNRRLRE